MANIGHPMTAEEVIGYILASLGPGHGDLFTAITVVSNQRDITLPEFYSYLIAHEAQATAMNGSVEFSSSANSVVKQETTSTCGSRRNFNNNNNGYNGSNNQQRSNYGGRGSRGHGRNYGGGPRCQVCGITDHTTLSCRNRFNHICRIMIYPICALMFLM